MRLNEEVRDDLRAQRERFLLRADLYELMYEFPDELQAKHRHDLLHAWKILTADTAWREADVSREYMTAPELALAISLLRDGIDQSTLAPVIEGLQEQLMTYAPVLERQYTRPRQAIQARNHLIRKRYPEARDYRDAREAWWWAFRELDIAVFGVIAAELGRDEANAPITQIVQNTIRQYTWFREADLHRWQTREDIEIAEIYKDAKQ